MLRSRAWLGVPVVAVAAALAAPGGIVDPRDRVSNAILGGGPGAVAPGAPASAEAAGAWARAHARRGDVLFPYSPAFLAALPESGEALSLPYGQAALLRRTLRRADWPVAGVVIAVPLVDGAVGTRSVAARTETFSSADWHLVRIGGPFADEHAALTAAADAFDAVDRAAVRRDFHLDEYVERNRRVLREALDAAAP